MTFLRDIVRSNILIKLRSWEYWPFGVIQAPIILYWFWLSIRARSLFFFSASNPGIVMGGMFGESKFDVLKKVPESVRAKAVLILKTSAAESMLSDIRFSGLTFPLIFKPDLGERGWRVKKIHNEEEAVKYLRSTTIDFLVQEFVGLPLEYGVFYVRYPQEQNGKIVSIVGKEMLSITGDGRRTLRELILSQDRAKLQWARLKLEYDLRLEEVIAAHTNIELVSIGNHCLGTKFLNNNHLITEKLSASFDQISQQIDGFYFGRFDLRVANLEDLEAGKVKIVELNGCGAEPAHIYQPGYPMLKGIAVLFKHWHDIFLISRENHRMGVNYVTFRVGRSIYNRFKSVVS